VFARRALAPPTRRRQFVTGAAAVLSAACIRAGGTTTPARERISLRPRLAPLAGSARRPAPSLLALGSSTHSTFAGHVNRPAVSGVTAGGVDHAPLPGDAEALQVRTRDRWEVETTFDYNVDQRIWYLWQRLGRGAHSLSAAEAAENRAALRAYMEVTPRLAAPLVERRR
jgi:hypothetical protein